ncbi:unnamed protein product [Ambrosiozyma monospora]|uniref:Unnamed protein product n=1 Tax=Ambrosiozyma monospora TaxID=43982 RepID=A0ACB5T3N9_AMBMO|nr:unnamed protein product [Ambrosiozyma monospora]
MDKTTDSESHNKSQSNITMISRVLRRSCAISRSPLALRSLSSSSIQQQKQQDDPKTKTTTKTKQAQSSIIGEADFAFRKQEIEKLDFKSQDETYYPPISNVRAKLDNAQTIRIPEFRQQFEGFFKENPTINKIEDQHFILNGKVKSIRRAGKGSIFIDLIQDGSRVQLMVHHKVMGLEKDQFSSHHANFKPGDLISCVGSPAIESLITW